MIGYLPFGAGFGVAQNATLATMFEGASPLAYGTASVLWNIAFDASLGGTGFGLIAARPGYPEAFALTVALVLAALWLAWGARRKAHA